MACNFRASASVCFVFLAASLTQGAKLDSNKPAGVRHGSIVRNRHAHHVGHVSGSENAKKRDSTGVVRRNVDWRGADSDAASTSAETGDSVRLVLDDAGIAERSDNSEAMSTEEEVATIGKKSTSTSTTTEEERSTTEEKTTTEEKATTTEEKATTTEAATTTAASEEATTSTEARTSTTEEDATTTEATNSKLEVDHVRRHQRSHAGSAHAFANDHHSSLHGAHARRAGRTHTHKRGFTKHARSRSGHHAKRGQ